jgi:hypothetical protein
MKNIMVLFLLMLALTGCNNSNEIEKIEFAPYGWGYYPNPYDSTTKFTLKLSHYYSIDKSGECKFLYQGSDRKWHCNTLHLDKKSVRELILRLDKIKSDTIFDNRIQWINDWNTLHMYDGPSYKIIVHRRRQTQNITFIEDTFTTLEDLHHSTCNMVDSCATCEDMQKLINDRNKLYRFMINSIELIIPPPRPPSPSEYPPDIAPVVVDTLNN